MPTFTYTAVNKDGSRESATVEAASLLAAGHLLKEQGLVPLELEEKHQQRFLTWLKNAASVPLKEKIVFIENLHLMLKAGIAVPRGLRIITKQSRNRKFKTILDQMANSVEAGKSLNEALSDYPKIFSHIFVSMVKVGEMSGDLEQSLEYLSIQLEREHDLKSKTKGAMMYPAVIVSAMVIIGILLAIFVLPKLTATFKEFNTQLPLTTRIVVSFTDFTSAHPVVILVALVAVVGAAVGFLKTPGGKRAFNWFLLHMPVINPIVKKINLARFSRILSSMMKSGISVVEGLQVTAEAMDNVYYKEVLMETSANVKLGKPLTQALSEHDNLFPVIVTQMLEVGEETGNIEVILQQLAESFEAEIDNTMKNLSSIIEPLLLLVIGAVVGFLALALISPIYSIGQNIQ
jgi:type IV pilus assembly protein PilC